MSRQTTNAKELSAIGPYSHVSSAVGKLFFLSGQIPVDPATGKIVDGGIQAQTKQVFANVKTVLKNLGLSLNDVVKTTVFLDNIADFAEVNKIYAEEFEAAGEKTFPSRSCLQVAALPMGAKIEIEVIASK